MADRSVSVFLKANVDGYLASVTKAKLATSDFARDASKSAQQHKEAWDKVGKTMLLTGGAIAAGFGLAVKASMNLDAQMAQTKSLLGEQGTAGAMKQLRTAAMSMGQGIGFSATQVADAETELVKAGLSVSDMLNGALKGALTLAADGQMDVADATSIAASAMTQFQLSGKDVPHIADLLAAGADKALGSVGDLGQALTSAGTVSHQFGFSLEDTVGTLAEFAQNAQIGERGGTLLRQMLLQLVNPSTQAKKIMHQYGLSISDANGQMVDSTTLAGNLQKSFGSLTPAVRNHALAVIFGSHAIQGANILVKDGAAVNAKWVSSVNDSGFAATQAAGKMDSLRGDLTKLNAAFQNDLINAGSEATGVLRGTAQAATGVLTDFAALPKPLQNAGLGLAGISSAALIAGGAVTVLLPKIGAAESALADMGKSGGLMSKGLKGAGSVLTGPWGVALAASVVGLGMFAEHQQKAREYVSNLTATLDTQTGAITANTRASVFKSLQDAGAVTAAKGLGINLTTLTDAATGNAMAMASVTSSLAVFNQIIANTVHPSGQMAANVGSVTRAVGGQDAAVKKAVAGWKDAAAAGVTADGTQQDLAASTAGVTTAATSAADAVTNYKNKLDGLNQPALDARSAARDYQAALDDATAALKKNGTTLDSHTAKGRANATALDAIASAARAQAEADKANGSSTKAVTAKLDDERTALYNTARQFGLSKTAAHNYVNEVLGIPKAVTTKVSTPGLNPAYASLKTYVGLIDSIPGTVRTNFLAQGRGAQGQTASKGHADGGPVVGPGTGTSDSVPIMASNGEYVLRAAAVDKIGVGYLDSLNRMASGGIVGKVHSAGRQAYATGGLVGAVNLSGIESIVGQTYSTRSDVTASIHAHTLAVNALKSAEHQLRVERGKAHPDMAKIHADERRVDADRQRVTSTTSKLKSAEASYAAGKKPLSTRYASAVASTARTDAQFLTDLNKISARGYGDLATELYAEGNPEAMTTAHQLAGWSNAKLYGLQSNLIKDSGTAAALSAKYGGTAGTNAQAAAAAQGQGPMVVYVQNPWGADYMQTQTGAVVARSNASTARSVTSRPR